MGCTQPTGRGRAGRNVRLADVDKHKVYMICAFAEGVHIFTSDSFTRGTD
ncbi:Hypothetical protein CulFRC58_2257 [Corynebacterium ulcerans FRC58]|uniref:Transposase n=1 Tax=Corynebacterium ulcerans FRC58 TaxID=1408268 RepID=A0ABN4H766_CORUL|nr:Hypothetical protein CulFRC58_2257 [Corynebacterium ulcerans FRC58]